MALGLCARDAVWVLLARRPFGFHFPFVGPFIPADLVLDPLASVFALAVVIVGVCVAIYAPGYVARAGHRMRGVTQQALVCLLEGSVLAVLVAGDLVTLFMAWEAMTAVATALVLADGHRAEVKRAAMLYIIINHVGTLTALAGLLLLGGGAAPFTAIRAAAAASAGSAAHTAGLVLVVAGFGTKAGIVPLHIWLPEAHPVAPSPVSALLSGVILKIGVYAVVRATCDLAGPPDAWLGFAFLVIGISSALYGVLYALMQHDLKRLLAFHSVENIGIIFLGIGLGITAWHAGLPTLSLLAFAAGLFHVVNHAVFKGLLFLCAGSVHLATHTRDLEEMGGLMKRMPSTARAFLVGALAISALPPLNGFASEWLILQGLIGAKDAQSWLLRSVSPLFAAGLALTGALAAACFVKAFAVAFLALPRSSHAEHAAEVPRPLRAAQSLLALACVALGLGSPWIMRVLVAAFGGGAGAAAGGLALGGAGAATVKPIAVAVAAVVVGGAVWLVATRGRAPARATQTWACGQGTVEGRAAYTASAFANPIRRIFSNWYAFQRTVEPVEGTAPYFVRRSRTHAALAPVFERWLYQPAVRLLERTSERFSSWSSPAVNRGLFFFALTLAVLLWWAVR